MGINSICVLGGGGFIGSHLVAQLASQYTHIKVLTRRRERHRHLLVLPTVELLEADIHDPAALLEQFQGVDAVINLVGILNEVGEHQQTFRTAHVALTRKVVDACKASRVGRLLHMSALHANTVNGGSEYLRSKGEAEDYLFTYTANSVQVSSFRPSVVFGPGDSFFNRFAGLLKIMPVFPLACPQSRFAPVYVGDVVNAFCADLADTQAGNRRYDLCGPEIYTLRQLVEYTAATLGLKRSIIGLPDAAARLQAVVMGHMPGKPFSYDNYLSLQTDSVCGDNCTPQPTAIDSVVPGYLVRAPKQDYLQVLRRRARRG